MSLRRDVETDGANTMEPKQQKFSIWYVLAALLASSITTGPSTTGSRPVSVRARKVRQRRIM